MTRPHEILDLGDVPLQCGITLRGAKLAYQTYGRLSAAQRAAARLRASDDGGIFVHSCGATLPQKSEGRFAGCLVASGSGGNGSIPLRVKTHRRPG